MSFVILSNLFCGGIVYNEFMNYPWHSLLLIGFGSLICISGILIILKKYSLVKTGTSVVLLEPQSLLEKMED